MKGEERNRVIIHIWTSEHNKVRPGQDVGHVSIEIPAFQTPADPGSGYYSLWPDLYSDARGGILVPGSGFYMKGYRRPEGVPRTPPGQMNEYDCDAEGRDAEITLCLYYLNIYKIREEFGNLARQVDKWVAIGKNILRPINNDALSCASLARNLLIAGDVEELLNLSAQKKWKKIPIPDAFVPLMVQAKETELELYPDVVSRYNYPEESDINTLAPRGLPGLNFLWENCSVM